MVAARDFRTGTDSPIEDQRVSRRREDPLVRSARREAVVTITIFTCALVYTVGYSTAHGFNRPLESLTFVLGFPDWVFWGILVPWGVCTLLACGLSFVFIQDEELEPAEPPPDSEEDGNAD